MRDHDAIFDDAREGSPFSNGESGWNWMSRWCHRCKVDGPFTRGEADQGCPLLLVALMERTPKEWTETGLQDYHCSEFVPDDEEGDGSEPTPPPFPQPVAEMDGQTDIFSAFADQIAEAVQPETAGAW